MDPKKFIKKFTAHKFRNILKMKDGFYLVDDEQLRFKDNLKEQPMHIGIYLGHMRKDDFVPSIALVEMIAKHSDRKLVVNKEAEWLFLCGRPLMGKSIIKSNVKDGLVLVQNENDENLGFGRVIGAIEKNDKIVVKNLLDRGNFLRREK